MSKENIRRNVYNLYMKGNSMSKIAKIFGIAPATVSSYVKSCEADIRKYSDDITKQNYLPTFLSRFEKIRDEAWAALSSCRNAAEKARFLKILLDVNVKELNALMDLGVIEKAADRVEHTVDGEIDHTSKFDEKQLEAISIMLISKVSGMTSESLINMGNNNLLLENNNDNIIDVELEDEPIPVYVEEKQQ